MALGLASDKIPNVRLNVAKVMADVGWSGKVDAARDALEAMREDKDTDVRYYAGKALEVK